MNKVLTTVTGVIAALVMFTGCSNITMLRTAELRSVQARVDSFCSNDRITESNH